MTFVAVPWANGNQVASTKLTNMVTNADHVRAEASYKMLVTEIQHTVSDGAPHSTVEFYLTIDGAKIGSGVTGVGYKSEVNISLSAVPVGFHKLSMRAGGYNLTSQVGAEFGFMRTADLNYLSYWVHLSTSDDDETVITGLTVIGHYASEATW